jgi:hypothetical protein
VDSPLPAGLHRLRLVPAEGAPRALTVEIRSDASTVVEVPLDSLPAP